MKKIKIFSFLMLISLLSACSDEVETAMVALEKYNNLMKEKEALEKMVSGLEKKISNLTSENKDLKYQVNKYKRLYQ